MLQRLTSWARLERIIFSSYGVLEALLELAFLYNIWHRLTQATWLKEMLVYWHIKNVYLCVTKSCAEKYYPIYACHFIHFPNVFSITLGITRCPTWRALDTETLFPQPSYSILHNMLFPKGGVCSPGTHQSWLQVSMITPVPLAVPRTCSHKLIGKNRRNAEKDLGNFLLRRKVNTQWHLQGLQLTEWQVPESSWELFREQQ